MVVIVANIEVLCVVILRLLEPDPVQELDALELSEILHVLREVLAVVVIDYQLTHR
jgi:hypothetical protein